MRINGLHERSRCALASMARKGTAAAAAEPLEVAATVSAVHPSATSNTVVVDVLLPEAVAARVAARAAAGEVALVLDARER